MSRRYENKVLDLWLDDFYPNFPGLTDWRLVNVVEYEYSMPPEERPRKAASERVSGTKVRATLQREIPRSGVNWAGWVTGAVITSSIWLTAMYILT